jgi:DNA-binding transcriptional LysR family regulator
MPCARSRRRRGISFTRAAIELCVTQAAVSHQVKGLEERLGVQLFRRLPRGLALTDEGLALLPALADSFDRIAELVEGIAGGMAVQVLSVAAVGTFATGWLLPRLPAFHAAHPRIDLRLFTNNNRVDHRRRGPRFRDPLRRRRLARHREPRADRDPRSRRSAPRRSPHACWSRAICSPRPCSAPIAPTNGRAGSPPPASPRRRCRARCSIAR